MFAQNGKISLRQMQALLILNIFSTGITSLPRVEAGLYGQRGWILTLGGGLIAMIFLLVITSLAERTKASCFTELLDKTLTRPAGIIISLGFSARLLIKAALELRIFSEIMQETMLMKTPVWLTFVLMLAVSGLIGYMGYECRGRAGEILVFLILIPLIFVFVLVAFSADFSELLPILPLDVPLMIQGSAASAFYFQGAELLLIGYPYIMNRKNLKKEAAKAQALIVALMTMTVVITIARFGGELTAKKLWPALQIMDTVDFPGAFIERLDMLVLGFLTMSTFAGAAAGIFFGSMLLSENIKRKHLRQRILLLCLPVVMIIGFYYRNLDDINAAYAFFNKYLGGFYFMLLPVVLLIAVSLKKGGDKVET